MQTSLWSELNSVPLASLFTGFIWTFARVSCALAFVAIPGLRSGADIPRIVLMLSMALAMFPRWGQPHVETLSMGSILTGLGWECTIGLVIGVVVALAIEAYQFAAQMIGLQAGLSYASTIDPTNEADSGVLLILVQLLTALLFLSLGMDVQLIAALSNSFDTFPPGGPPGSSLGPNWMAAGTDAVIQMGGQVLALGLRLAMPVVVFLLLLDLALALLGRVEQQFQLSGVLFPAKLGGAFLAVAGVLNAVPWLVEHSVADVHAALGSLVAR